MKALAFPWFVVKVRLLCTRGLLKAVEAGKPDRALMVRQVRGRSGIVFKVSEEFFPLCFTRFLRNLADLGACFKVLSAVFR